MHEPRRTHDLAAECLADRLMTEADAEDRHFSGERADQGDEDAGLRGCFGPGRQHRGGGFEGKHVGDAQRIVPIDDWLFPQLAEVLNQVVGERIVVVEDEQHASNLLSYRRTRPVIACGSSWWLNRWTLGGILQQTVCRYHHSRREAPC